MTTAEALREAVARLRAAGVADPAMDARLLLAHALGVDRTRLLLHLPDAITSEAADRLERAIAARCRRQPVSQIVGTRRFWGRDFQVTRDVLDPRPETEVLVAAALERPFASVLDLGTGSGAILLSLLAERPEARGTGTDLSLPALAVAERNCVSLGLENRALFVQSNWFDQVTGSFDLIVSNPPYVTESEMAGLSPEVLDWEPHLALSPGGDGLAAYRAIALGAAAHLTPHGQLLVEIGLAQAGEVSSIFNAAGLRTTACLRDLDGRDRVVIAENARNT